MSTGDEMVIFGVWYFASNWLAMTLMNMSDYGGFHPVRALPCAVLLCFMPILGQITAFGIWLLPFVMAFEWLSDWADDVARRRP